MQIRKMTIDDYEEVYGIWQECGFQITKSDNREEVKKFIEKNPTTSLVAVVETGIAGSILGGFDGRRGLVHHLSVRNEYRKRGFGKALINALEDEFKKIGVVKMSFWVKMDNLKVVDFYKSCGYERREDIITMSKNL